MSKIKIKGNIESIKKSVLNQIEELFTLELSKEDFVPKELAFKLAEFTGKINREISVYINRKGALLDISIGDIGTVSLPAIDSRRSLARLSGVRCIHTHPGGDGRLSDVDISSLLKLKLDAMIALGVNRGKIGEVYVALPMEDEAGDLNEAEVYGPLNLDNEILNTFINTIEQREKSSKTIGFLNEDGIEKAILVGLETSSGKIINEKSEGERSLEELQELAITAGVEVVQKILQRKSSKDTAFYIGKGKTGEINLMRQALNANVIIFDDELSGAQFRNIEEVVGVKVIDRTTLILDIFAQRARSREGKLQVELAQLKYRLPRLIGLGNQLSRLGGGIGTRGPGEKKLEVDRRHIRRRVTFLENELEGIGKRRGLMREGRRNNEVPSIALVGYTNAGKSTLMNTLCKTDVFAEDKLFATLDPTIRKLNLPDDRETILIDTVGFIRKLPHELIEAFKSTLEETVFSDILLHVVDASSDECEEQVSVVNDILSSLGATNRPVIMVLNKIDLLSGTVRLPIKDFGNESIEVSASTGIGLNELLQRITEVLPQDEIEIDLLAPYKAGWIIPFIHENGKLLKEEFNENGVIIKATLNKIKIDRLREYITNPIFEKN